MAAKTTTTTIIICDLRVHPDCERRYTREHQEHLSSTEQRQSFADGWRRAHDKDCCPKCLEVCENFAERAVVVLGEVTEIVAEIVEEMAVSSGTK